MKRELPIEDCYVKGWLAISKSCSYYYYSMDNFIRVWSNKDSDNFVVNPNPLYFEFNLGLSNLNELNKEFKDLLKALQYALDLEKKYIKHNMAARIKGMMRLTVMITKLKERRKVKCQ